ncbi:MAG: hypothetical protein HZA19_02820 [Nitrospirae bacterium]|nr:hypothetical protein [Nitrospirota bacterium]
MDIGSNTENLLRGVSCNVLISNRTFVPPIDMVAEYSIAWTEEALRRMEKVPSFARGVAKTAVHRYAVERGHTIISNSVIDSALGHILPESAMKAMMGVTKALAEKKVDQEMAAESGAGSAIPAGKILSYEERLDRLDHYMCQGCGHMVRGEQPVKCSICSAEGSAFEKVDRRAIQDSVESEGGVEAEKTFDDVTLEWTSDARARLREVASGYTRRRSKAIIEKRARKMGLRTITVDMASKVILEYADEVRWKDEMLVGENLRSGISTPAAVPVKAYEGTLEWASEALQRLERVPAGYMRDSTRGTVEKHAHEKGIAAITLQVCEEGIEKAKVIMEEAMKNPQALEELLKNLGKNG